MLFLIVVLLKSRIVLKIYFQKCLILNVFIYQQNCLTQLIIKINLNTRFLNQEYHLINEEINMGRITRIEI